MVDDDLANYLDTISQGEIYRVDAVLKDTDLETTERVFLVTANGSEQGPYIRKRIAVESGLGKAYERLWEAQQEGKRFMHLPRILAYETVDGYRDVVMEYVGGLTLEDAVMTSEYSEQAAAALAGLACDAVMELHESLSPALIHRDLKPSNVIVSPSNLTLIDLGISRTFDEEASADTRSFGTRGYAPPEQFGYGQTDERSDIYALGMLIAYCFLREEPTRSLIESGFDDERIPASFRPVLAKATAFDPQRRFSSVRGLKDSAGFACVSDKPGITPSETPAFSSRIPRWLGVAWNAAIIAIWGLLTVASISLTFAPPPTEPMQSPFARAIGYLGTFVVGFGFIGFALLDKRRLRHRIPNIAKTPWYRQTMICLGVGIAIVLVSVIVGTTLDQATA